MLSRYSYSEESDVSNSYVKSSFRVSVCLRRYFKDVRAKCYILVSRNRRVRWLEKRIQKVFALPGTFCLCVNGHFLPSAEPLALLGPEDRVEVIPQKQEHIKKQNSVDVAISNQYSESEVHNKQPLVIPTLEDSDFTFNHEIITSEKDHAVQQKIKHRPDQNIGRDDTDYGGAESAVVSPSNTILTDSSKNNATLNSQNETQVQNGIDDPHSLQESKKRAFALLDLQGDPEKDDSESAGVSVGPRRRRRVRRRPKRSEHSVLLSADSITPTNLSDPINLGSPTLDPPSVSAAVEAPSLVTADLSADAVAWDNANEEVLSRENCKSPSGEIARNETITSRKPRVIHAINN